MARAIYSQVLLALGTTWIAACSASPDQALDDLERALANGNSLRVERLIEPALLVDAIGRGLRRAFDGANGPPMTELEYARMIGEIAAGVAAVPERVRERGSLQELAQSVLTLWTDPAPEVLFERGRTVTEDTVALTEVHIRRQAEGPSASVDIRLALSEDGWKVVGVERLGAYLAMIEPANPELRWRLPPVVSEGTTRGDSVAIALAAFDAAAFDTIFWPTERRAMERGGVVYLFSCLKCHGDVGGGDGNFVYQNETLRPPSFLTPEWRFAEDGLGLREAIFAGNVGGMPYWGLIGLRYRDIDAVASYIVGYLRPNYGEGK